MQLRIQLDDDEQALVRELLDKDCQVIVCEMKLICSLKLGDCECGENAMNKLKESNDGS